MTLLIATPWPAPVVVAYAGVVGVAIDIDHFPIARVNTGDWSALRRCVISPRRALFAQQDIFPEMGVWPLQRLLSHVVITGIVTAGLLFVSVPIAVVTGVTLYAHVVSDLVADVHRHDEYHRRHARYVREGGLDTTSPPADGSDDDLSNRQ